MVCPVSVNQARTPLSLSQMQDPPNTLPHSDSGRATTSDSDIGSPNALEQTMNAGHAPPSVEEPVVRSTRARARSKQKYLGGSPVKRRESRFVPLSAPSPYAWDASKARECTSVLEPVEAGVDHTGGVVRRLRKRNVTTVQPLACYFCRKRKIACRPVDPDSGSKTTCM